MALTFPVDLHLLVQALLYFAAVLCGLIAAIPTELSKSNSKDRCILYATVTWATDVEKEGVEYHAYVTIDMSDHNTGCNFIIGTFVAVCIVYSLAMGCYYAYAVRKSVSDKDRARQMWAMPFLLLNALGTFVVFSAACVISVGFHSYCKEIMKGNDESINAGLTSCGDPNVPVDNMNGKHSLRDDYRYFTVAEIAGWIAVLIWVLQTAFTILRMIRNRRQRSQETFQGITTADTDKMASNA